MRALVTASRTQAARLASRLQAAGVDAIACPLVETEPVGGSPIRVEGFDWVVLTSRNAVEELFGRLEGPLPRVAAIGPGTAEALRAHGVEPALVPARSTQEGLVEAFPSRRGRVLFIGAENARGYLARELGASTRVIYRTVERVPDRLPAADLAVVASGTAARALARAGWQGPCVSIGPTTSAAARAAGLRVEAEAASSDLDGLVEAVRLAGSRHLPHRP